MKWITALAAALLTAQASEIEPAALKTQNDKDSYAIGADLARNLKRQGVQIEVEVLLRGMRDGLTDAKRLMTEDEIRETLRAYQTELRRKQFQARGGTGPIAEANLEKGAAFLAQNKTKEGVVTLPSGLQYKVLKAGNGRKPTATDTVECHHRGVFIDGTEYNSTYRIGMPATLKVNEGIAAWKEVLPLMPMGSTWQLFVPPHLAYGERGVVDAKGRPKIGPNTTMIFELELVGIK